MIRYPKLMKLNLVLVFNLVPHIIKLRVFYMPKTYKIFVFFLLATGYQAGWVQSPRLQRCSQLFVQIFILEKYSKIF